MKICLSVFCLFFFLSCSSEIEPESSDKDSLSIAADSAEEFDVFIEVLGTVQDGGSPHIGCKKNCCKELFEEPDPTRQVVCLGVIDRMDEQSFLFEATPDISRQMKKLKQDRNFGESENPDGIFLTHAHIGHYAGLVYLGKEALNAQKVPVYAMPKMKGFIEDNAPWNQLVVDSNIVLYPLQNEESQQLTTQLEVTPFLVPHRDELSETVGYLISGPEKKALFIPDINKWDIWEKDIRNEIEKVDYAFIDATFYDENELTNRNMSEIPHPFIVESMALFEPLPAEEKQKVYFIHLNHSNPALDRKSEAFQTIKDNGFKVALYGQRFKL